MAVITVKAALTAVAVWAGWSLGEMINQNAVKEENAEEERKRKARTFPGAPQDLANDPDWQDVTHIQNSEHMATENLKTLKLA